MPTYDVTLSRIIEVETTITVEAPTVEAAAAKAVQRGERGAFIWAIGDNYRWEEMDQRIEISAVDEA